MRIRRADEGDTEFLREMARLAAGLDDRALPAPDDPAVLALLPGPADLAAIAVDDRERRLGAAWLHFHDPPLVVEHAGPLPELTLAVLEDARGRGTGRELLAELAAAGAASFTALVLNVHLRNPAVRLYMRSGFTVAGKGRGPFGVAMVRRLERAD